MKRIRIPKKIRTLFIYLIFTIALPVACGKAIIDGEYFIAIYSLCLFLVSLGLWTKKTSPNTLMIFLLLAAVLNNAIASSPAKDGEKEKLILIGILGIIALVWDACDKITESSKENNAENFQQNA